MNDHQRDFERWLRHNKVPYIAVDEAKKALKASGTLDSFHFVVYQDGSGDGPNLLCYVIRRPQHDHRFNMEQWQDVFGHGFASCFVEMEYGEPVFRWVNGDEFVPCFVKDTRAPNAKTDALAKARTEGDETALIEWLSDNDPLYAEVEDVATEADQQDRADDFNRLADWMDEYRRCLIAGDPTPPSPLPVAAPVPKPRAPRRKPEATPAKPAPHVTTPDPQPFTAKAQLGLFG